jgi:hypothetical protein
MKFRATITVEFEAEDVYDERRHKACLTAFMDRLADDYAAPTLGLHVRRTRNKPRAAAPEKLEGGVQIVRALYVG